MLVKILLVFVAIFAILQSFFLLFWKNNDKKFTFKNSDKILTVFIQSIYIGLLYSFLFGMLMSYIIIIVFGFLL